MTERPEPLILPAWEKDVGSDGFRSTVSQPSELFVDGSVSSDLVVIAGAGGVCPRLIQLTPTSALKLAAYITALYADTLDSQSDQETSPS